MLIAVIEIMALLAVLVLVRISAVNYNLVFTAAQRFIQILISVSWLEMAGKIFHTPKLPRSAFKSIRGVLL